MNACPNGVGTPSCRKRAVSHRRRRRTALCLVRRLRVPGCTVSGSGACRMTNPDGLPGGTGTAGRCKGLVGLGRAAGTVAVEKDLEMGRTGQEVGVRPFCRLNNIGAAPWWWLRQGAAQVVGRGSWIATLASGSPPRCRRTARVFQLSGQSQFTSCSDGKTNGNWRAQLRRVSGGTRGAVA